MTLEAVDQGETLDGRYLALLLWIGEIDRYCEAIDVLRE